MKWDELRDTYPDQWVVFEALIAHSIEDKRLLDEITLIEISSDSSAAIQRYLELHHDCPERELYVAHTSRESLDIKERKWLGVRKAA